MKECKFPSIYKIICTVNNKMYVGSAVNPRQRYHQHVGGLRRGDHDNNYLQNSWNRYGEDSFLFRIIEKVEDKGKLIEREQFHMDLQKSYDSEYGFNLSPTAGSSLGIKRSAECRKRNSESQKGEKSAWYGRHHTKESCDLLSERNGEYWVVTSPLGEFVTICSLRRFCKDYGLHDGAMNRVAQGKQSSHKGWKCLKLDEEGNPIKFQPVKRPKRRTSYNLSLTWEVTDPDGKVQTIKNLKNFCKENGLHNGHMSYVASGKQKSHKDWTCRKLGGNKNGT